MRYISDIEYENKLREIQKENDTRLKVQKLNEEKNKYKKKKTTTSKKAMWIMMAIMFEIVVFAQVVMWCFGDFSSLYVLIGIPASMIPIVWKYLDKSAKQNQRNGIVFQTAMREQSEIEEVDSFNNIENNDESGELYQGAYVNE